MITLYITIGFFTLLTGFLTYKKKKVAAIIFGVITALSVLSTVQIYKSAVALNEQPISQRREQIISMALSRRQGLILLNWSSLLQKIM